MEDESTGKPARKTRSLAEFVNHLRAPYEPFDVEPGLLHQVRMAETFAKLIDPARVTPETMKKLLRPLDHGVNETHDSTNQQDALIMSATARFIHMVLLAYTGGDQDKVKQLVGYSAHGQRYHEFEDPEFIQAVIDELQDHWRSERSAGLRR